MEKVVILLFLVQEFEFTERLQIEKKNPTKQNTELDSVCSFKANDDKFLFGHCCPVFGYIVINSPASK